jgi:hypothetical protein
MGSGIRNIAENTQQINQLRPIEEQLNTTFHCDHLSKNNLGFYRCNALYLPLSFHSGKNTYSFRKFYCLLFLIQELIISISPVRANKERFILSIFQAIKYFTGVKVIKAKTGNN